MQKIKLKGRKINKKLVLIISLLIVAIILISLVILQLFKSSNTNKLTTAMQFKYFGYDKLYNGESENLTIGEVNKILLNVYSKNPSDDVDIVDESLNELDPWVKCGYINSIISKSESEHNITFLRMYEMLYDARLFIAKIENYNKNTLELKTQEYTERQISAINYLYDNGLISGNDIVLDKINDYASKEYFEDLIVKYIFKFNLINIDNEEIDYEKSLKLTDNKKYFFIQKGITKKELNYNTLKPVEYIEYREPKDTYSDIVNDVNYMSTVINDYFDIVLNINFENLEKKEFVHKVKKLCIMTTEDCEAYYEYVKENNIVLEGNSTAIIPIIYYIDGIYYVRTKIEFSIKNSNTKENVLLGDLKYGSVKYANNVVKYIDIPLEKTTFECKLLTSNINDYIVK